MEEPNTASRDRTAHRRLRVLFFVHSLGKTRHFEGIIRRLADRGHTVTLAAAAKRGGLKAGKTFHGLRRVEIVPCPNHRIDRWRALAPQLRLARDYLRFFEPAYRQADKLSARAASYAPDTWRALVERHPWIVSHPDTAGQVLRLAESAIPPDKYFELFIRYHAPDVVLVTPLVDFGSYQTDYVKAAHHLRIPVAFLPFSWDNLTNRGLIRVEPDRVLVWNEFQKREAVELHRIADDKVVVTGAARFDDFFDLEPSTSREEFCRTAGLDPEKPFLLYGCSSPFVAPHEVQFVREWIARLRGSADPAIASAGVLVRPHPVHEAQWEGVSLADFPNASVWRGPARMNADQSLYDSLHHSAALVGLNTSAMLEAAIVGRPVLSILAQDFAGGQDHTLHFQYLKQENGGLVETARDLAEHETQLARVLLDPKASTRRARVFVNSFIRPRGRHHRVDRIVVGEIERTAELRKSRRLPALWQYPARWTLQLASRYAGG